MFNINLNIPSWFRSEPNSRPNAAAGTQERSLLSRISDAVTTALKCLALVFFLWANTKIAFAGFLFGILEREKVEQYVNRINEVWEQSKGLSAAAIVIITYMSLPMTIAAGSFLSWAQLSARWIAPKAADASQQTSHVVVSS